MINRFFNVTGFSHFTMVNASLVCCVDILTLFTWLTSCLDFREAFRERAELCTRQLPIEFSISL